MPEWSGCPRRVPTPPSHLVAGKPSPGLLLRAAADLSIDLNASWAIGDRARDIEAGAAAGCRTIAVDPVPPAKEAEDFGASEPEYRARDLVDAARYIIAHS